MIAVVEEKTDSKTLVNVGFLVTRWSLSRNTIYDLMSAGKLPSVKIGRARRIPMSSVLAFEKGWCPASSDPSNPQDA